MRVVLALLVVIAMASGFVLSLPDGDAPVPAPGIVRVLPDPQALPIDEAAAISDTHADVGPTRKPPTRPMDPHVATADARVKAIGMAQLLERFLAASDDQPDHEAEKRLHQAMDQSSSVRADLMRRYFDASDSSVKSRLKDLFKGSLVSDVDAFTTRLIQSASAVERQHGFDLLATLEQGTHSIQKVTHALGQEHDSAVLASALSALEHMPAVNPQDSAPMLDTLRPLAQHADPTVRARSIWLMGQWDRTGKVAEVAAMGGLSDMSQGVRIAAIASIGENRLRSEPIKTALLQMMSSSGEVPRVRYNAMQALVEFDLTTNEFAQIERARSEVARLPMN